SVALPADPDDHHGGDSRRPAADARHRHRFGTAPAARHRHYRRTCVQPIADAVHHARHLSLLRPAGGALDPTPAGKPAGSRRASRMNIAAPFTARPVATTLLTIAIALAGLMGFSRLPVSPLPQVDFPTISVSATLPGASPETVATSVAEPLERHLGQIANVTEMTSQSGIGHARITRQFDASRDIDGAARDVQAAINAARADLPTNLPSNPTYRKVNPADAPILILALTSKTMTQGQMYDAASNILAQRLSQLSGIGNVNIGGSSLPAVRVELNPQALYNYGIGLEDVRAALASANANSPKGTIDDGGRRFQIYTNDQANVAADYAPL